MSQRDLSFLNDDIRKSSTHNSFVQLGGSHGDVSYLFIQYRHIKFRDNEFVQNYAGQRASVINLLNI